MTFSYNAPKRSARADILTRRTYNRPLNEEGTLFETWAQTVARVRKHQTWLWERAQGDSLSQKQKLEMDELESLLLNRVVSVAGRTLWLGGTDIVKKVEAASFNCSGIEVRTVHDVVDVFWLLLQGCGVGVKMINGTLSGFTRKMEIEIIRSTRTEAGGNDNNVETFDPATKTWTIQIGDSAVAWSKSIGKIMAGKFPAKKLVIDLSQIRPAGKRLKGYGWICSGDGPFSIALEAICAIMNHRAGKLLSKIDIMDIIDWLGTVLSSRRSAIICLMDYGDPEWRQFSLAKTKETLKTHWHRSQSNNSLIFWSQPTRKQLKELFDIVVANGGGEPGFINGVSALQRAPWFKTLNPCAEILLSSNSFCVSGDTHLITRTGLVKIKDVVGTVVEIWNGQQWSTVTPRITGEKQKLVRVLMNDGSYLDCTPYHRFSIRDHNAVTYSEVQAKDLLSHSYSDIHTEPFKIDHDSGVRVETAYKSGLQLEKSKKVQDAILDVFGWDKRSMLEFVAGIADSTGKNTEFNGIQFFVTSYERARYVQLLLTKCAVLSFISRKSKTKDLYAINVTDCATIPCKALDTSKGHPANNRRKYQVISDVVELPGEHTVYCFDEPLRHMGVFGNTLTYQCNLVELDVAKWKHDHLGMHKALNLIARANYRQTVVNLRDGILQDSWHQTNEFLRLCGVGLTGICRREDLTAYDYKQLKNTAIHGTYSMSDELGLERPKNSTCQKPAGSLSKSVFDTTEGAHRPNARYIFNNVVFSKHDPLVEILRAANYKIMPHPYDATSVLICLPISYDDIKFDTYKGREINLESAVSQLERYKMLQENYVEQNTSITISYDVSEVEQMIDWYLKNWNSYVATSFLFRTDVTMTAEQMGFPYLPQEVVTKETYDEYAGKLLEINIDNVGSMDTPLEEDCSTGACPIR